MDYKESQKLEVEGVKRKVKDWARNTSLTISDGIVLSKSTLVMASLEMWITNG